MRAIPTNIALEQERINQAGRDAAGARIAQQNQLEQQDADSARQSSDKATALAYKDTEARQQAANKASAQSAQQATDREVAAHKYAQTGLPNNLQMARGGAIPSFDDGGEAPDFGGGGFGGGDTTPQPASGTPPAGQDTPQQGNNVFGSQVTQTPQQLGGSGAGGLPGAYQVDQTPGQNTIGPPGLQDRIQAIKAYLSGAGAMPKDQFELTNDKIDPQHTMDQNERSMRAFDVLKGPDATGYAQALRQHYDAYRGNAAKMIDEGNVQLAAQEASKGFQYVPDGTKTMVTPTKQGDFTVTTHTMDGQDQTQTLTGEQMKSFLTGAHGLFDHVVNAGVGGALGNIAQQAAQPKGSQGEFGGPPQPQAQPAESFQQYGPTEDQREGGPPSPTHITKDKEGNTHYIPEDEVEGFDNVLHKKNVTFGEGPGPGEEEPIRVVKAGNVTYQGNAAPPKGTDPALVKIARQQFPNDPEKQAQYYGQQHTIAQEQANKVDVARNQRFYGSQATGEGRVAAAEAMSGGRRAAAETAAQGRVQEALIKAQSLTSNTNGRVDAEQARTAAQILQTMMKNNPGAPIGDQIKALRAGNINDALIAHLVNPEAAPEGGQAPARGRRLNTQAPPQPQGQLNPAAAAPKVAAPTATTGEIRVDAQGNRWTKDAQGNVVPAGQ